jgi:hypothetical protein
MISNGAFSPAHLLGSGSSRTSCTPILTVSRCLTQNNTCSKTRQFRWWRSFPARRAMAKSLLFEAAGEGGGDARFCESTNVVLAVFEGSDGMARKAVIRKAGRPPGGVNGQRVRDYPQVSIRVPPKLYAQLATLSRSTGLSRLEIFIRAIDCFEGQLRSQRKRQNSRRRTAA